MKKRISRREVIASCVLVLLAGTALSACKEKAPAAASSSQSADNAVTPLSRERTLRRGVAIYSDKDGNNTPLYAEDKDGKMAWADEAVPGSEIFAYESLESSADLEVKNAVRKSGEKEEAMDFVHVRYFGKDYWTRPIFITGVPNLDGAVIKEDTYIYSSTDLVNAKTTKVEKGTFVASQGKTSIDGINFYHVYFYSWNTPYGKEGYVKEDSCSDYYVDVYAAQVERAFSFAKDLKPYVRDEVNSVLEEIKEI